MPDDTSFSGLFLEVLHRAKTPDQTKHEADYVEMLLDLTPPARLLDVPCGAGRIGLELAARKYQVTGIDLAEPLLDLARHATDERQLTARFAVEQRDMRDLPWTSEFDAAYSLWESFGYFDDAGNAAFLRAAASTLKPGGKFMFDTHIIESIIPTMHRREWERLGDDLLVLEERGYDHTTAIMTRYLTFVREGQVERRALAFRLYTYRELVALLEACGFTDCQGYSWLSILPYSLAASRLVMVATKA
jgi:SAM-dependent methyltransferase